MSDRLAPRGAVAPNATLYSAVAAYCSIFVLRGSVSTQRAESVKHYSTEHSGGSLIGRVPAEELLRSDSHEHNVVVLAMGIQCPPAPSLVLEPQSFVEPD